MKIKYLMIIGIVLMVLPLISSAQTTLGTYKKGSCIDLIQTCGKCTFNNVTSILHPNGTRQPILLPMTKTGSEFNLTHCFPNTLGKYFINGDGDFEGDDVPVVWVYDLVLTQEGREKMNTGEGISLFISFIVMLIIAICFLLIAGKFEGFVGKFIFTTISIVIFLIIILYSIVILEQAFGGFSTLTESYNVFYTVIKVIFGVLITFGFVVLFLFALRTWKIKRGLLDED